jgi:hypothetical protein
MLATMLLISYILRPSFSWSLKHSSAKFLLTATLLQNVTSCLHLHLHRFCWFVYRCYLQIDSVLSLQMQCSTEEFPLEGSTSSFAVFCCLQVGESLILSWGLFILLPPGG